MCGPLVEKEEETNDPEFRLQELNAQIRKCRCPDYEIVVSTPPIAPSDALPCYTTWASAPVSVAEPTLGNAKPHSSADTRHVFAWGQRRLDPIPLK